MSALFVDALTVIDFTYLHATRGLVGESWVADIELHGALDEQGMVLDFGAVKKALKQEIDRLADHRLLVPAALPGLDIVDLPDGNLQLRYQRADDRLLIECPPVAVLRLPVSEVEPQGLAAYLTNALRAVVPANVERIVVQLREEHIDGAYYHYSHGLKKHRGSCQRIAHGQRSRIEDTQGQALEVRHAVRLPDNARAVGQCLHDLDLARTGAEVRGVRRDGAGELQPRAELRLLAGDVVVLFGTAAQVESAERRLLGG